MLHHLRLLGKLCNSKINYAPVGLRNYWRRNAFSELSSAVQTVENRMREMDRGMSRFFDDIQRSSPVKLPRLSFPPLERICTRDIPVISTDSGTRNYRLELDMQGMEPENINVSLKDRELTITARREEKRSDGSRFVHENSYHYTIPREVNPDTIRSCLSEGILTIEAPLPAMESKEIPIKMEASEFDNSGEKEHSETKKQ